jgi:hypothetical protein
LILRERLSGYPGAPEAAPLAAEADGPAVVAAAVPCLKIADTMLPKMLIFRLQDLLGRP